MTRDELVEIAAAHTAAECDAPTTDVRELAPGVMTTLDPRDNHLIFYFDGEIARFSTSDEAKSDRAVMDSGLLEARKPVFMFAAFIFFPTDWEGAYELARRQVVMRDGSDIVWHNEPIRLVGSPD